MDTKNTNIPKISDSDIQKYIDLSLDFALSLLGAIVIFIIGKWVARKITNIIEKSLNKGGIDSTLSSFITSVTYATFLAFVVITAIGTLGINTSSFAAVIAAAGLAVGLAFQSSLSNLASGVMIIIFKPFSKGDYVEVAGTQGTVEDVNVFTTNLTSPDNKAIIIPNGSISTNNIVNYSKKSTRRVDMVFGIGYDDDIKLAKETLQEVLQKNSKIFTDPKPVIAVKELADSSINFVCRPWCKTSDYWDVYFSTQESVKLEFDKAGISIPYPQQDVNIHKS